MRKSDEKDYSKGEQFLILLLIFCLMGQIWYLFNDKTTLSMAQYRPIGQDGMGGPAAPSQSGDYHPPGSMFPSSGDSRIEPPTQGRMEPPSGAPAGAPGSPPPGMRPGGRVTTYPKIPKGRKLTDRDKQVIETRYLLHRWVLSDLLWGIDTLEKSKDHRLNDTQIKKIFPSIKKLATSVEIVEESNRLMQGLLREDQVKYFEAKLYNGAYMSGFMAKYSPGVNEPVFGVSSVIFAKCKEIVEKKAQQQEKK